MDVDKLRQLSSVFETVDPDCKFANVVHTTSSANDLEEREYRPLLLYGLPFGPNKFEPIKWPKHSHLPCWNCMKYFDTPPVPMVLYKYHRRQLFVVTGNFCRVSCSTGFLESHRFPNRANLIAWTEEAGRLYFGLTKPLSVGFPGYFHERVCGKGGMNDKEFYRDDDAAQYTWSEKVPPFIPARVVLEISKRHLPSEEQVEAAADSATAETDQPPPQDENMFLGIPGFQFGQTQNLKVPDVVYRDPIEREPTGKPVMIVNYIIDRYTQEQKEQPPAVKEAAKPKQKRKAAPAASKPEKSAQKRQRVAASPKAKKARTPKKAAAEKKKNFIDDFFTSDSKQENDGDWTPPESATEAPETTTPVRRSTRRRRSA